MLEGIKKGLQDLKSKICEKQGHDNQNILRICINEQCQIKQNNQQDQLLLCPDCLINHASHYSDCIKIDQFIMQSNQHLYNSQNQQNQTIDQNNNEDDLNRSNNDGQIDIDQVIISLKSQLKNFKKKIKEIFQDYKKIFKSNYNESIIDQLLQYQSKQNNKNNEIINVSIKQLIQNYKGNISLNEDNIQKNVLLNRIMKQSQTNLTYILEEISNVFNIITLKSDNKISEIKNIITNECQSEEIITQEEEKQKNIIHVISTNSDELIQQIKSAEENKLILQKDYQKYQRIHFELQEKENQLYYKVEQKKKLNLETKRSFMQKIQNLMEKQINIKYLEEQRIQIIVNGLTQPYYENEQNNNNNNFQQNQGSPFLIEDQDMSYQNLLQIDHSNHNHSQQYSSQNNKKIYQNGIDKLNYNNENENNNDNNIEEEKQNKLELEQQISQFQLSQQLDKLIIDDGPEKEKYLYLEKTRQQLQEKQEEYLQLYQKEIQSLQNQLLDTQNQKETCAVQLESSKNKYNQSIENLKLLQLQLSQNDSLKFQEKKKLVDIYKKSPIKKKPYNFKF